MTLERPEPESSAPEAAAAPGSRARRVRFTIPASSRVAWVTPTLVAANVAVLLAMIASGVSPLSPTVPDLYTWGADYGPAVAGGQWWRLLSSAFVHVGIVHIAFNMYVLWGAGVFAERVYGNVEFLLVYLLAAVSGSLVSTVWSPEVVAAGASGAVFGVYGAILAFSMGKGHDLPDVVAARLRKGALTFVLLNVVLGLAIPQISNSAHLGGLAGGFVAGWLLAPGPAPRRARWRRLSRALALLPVLALLAWGVRARVSRLPSQQAARHLGAAKDALDREDWKAAQEDLSRVIALDPDNAYTFLLRGYAREKASDRAGAIADYGEAIARAPRAAEPLAYRCLARYRASDYAGAEADCDAAIALDPESAEAWHGRSEILGEEGRAEEALAAARSYLRLAPGEAHSHLLLASALITTRDLEGARSEVETAELIDPDSAELVARRAQLLLHEGDLAAAVAEADRVVAAEPEEAWPYSSRSAVRRAAGDTPGAVTDALRSAALEPDEARWHAALAWTLAAAGRAPEAAAAVEQALALVPEHPQALGARCFLRVSQGDRAGGRSDCERVVALFPGDETALGMLAFLDDRPSDATASWTEASLRSPPDAAYLATWIARARSGDPAVISPRRGAR